MSEDSQIEDVKIFGADLRDAEHAAHTLTMIRSYARDPFGQGRDLDESIQAVLIERLAAQSGAFVFLATLGPRPIGIAVCFSGFSTFAARPLINLHDIYVDAPFRGWGVARRLLEAVESQARALDCCKLTLEVQERNTPARSLYERFGFTEGIYDAEAGHVLFRWKAL